MYSCSSRCICICVCCVFVLPGKLVFLVQLVQIFVFQLIDMFCVSANHITWSTSEWGSALSFTSCCHGFNCLRAHFSL